MMRRRLQQYPETFLYAYAVKRFKSYRSTVYSRGAGVFGALGTGNLRDQSIFRKIELSDENLFNCSAGLGHSILLSKLGLYLIGRPYDFVSLMRINHFYEGLFPFIGRFISATTYYFGDKSGIYLKPILIEDFQKKFRDVSCGAGLTILLGETGEVFCFGQNRWGQCGVQTDGFHIYTPRKIPSLTGISHVEAGLQHALCLSQSGDLFAWGKGERGQLGDGLFENSPVPRKVLFNDLAPDVRPVSISSGWNHNACLMSDGSVYVWGKGWSTVEKSSNLRGIRRPVTRCSNTYQDIYSQHTLYVFIICRY